ncbi:hypothetical protein ACO3TA_00575 [Methanocaldococcus sp. 28A]
MKVALICTLGNRDIQFKKEYKEELKEILKDIIDYESKDSDSVGFTIKRDNFLKNTKMILDNYEKVKKYFILPIIDTAINYIQSELNGNLKKIILVPTNQQDEKDVKDNHKKSDTFNEAKIIEKLSKEKGFQVEIKEAKFNASKVENWFNLFINILNDNYDKFDKLVFSISPGVPQSREGVRLATLFKDKCEVIEISGGRVTSDNMKSYEKQIIKEKIKDLIKNYNYTGALEFNNYLTEEIINTLKYLNYRLNFNFESANKIANNNKIVKKYNSMLENIKNEKNTIKKLEYLILELLDNMEIELKKEEYTNFLARVYRLEEAVGQYLVLKYLKENDYTIKYKYNKYNKEKSFKRKSDEIDIENDVGINKILSCYFNRILKTCYDDKEIELQKKLKLIIDKNNKKYKFTDNLNTNNYKDLINILCNKYENELVESISKIYKKPNNRNLRHTTIVAHGFRGVSKEDIEDGLNKDINDFFKEEVKNRIYNIIGKDLEENIFNKINHEIIDILNKT